jgi:hypothetical protein
MRTCQADDRTKTRVALELCQKDGEALVNAMISGFIKSCMSALVDRCIYGFYSAFVNRMLNSVLL